MTLMLGLDVLYSSLTLLILLDGEEGISLPELDPCCLDFLDFEGEVGVN